jgi:hypothetical protein
MLIDEFVELRVRAGETERTTQEQEHVRRAGERGRWLRSWGERRSSAPVDATVVAAPSSVVAELERELAHAAR